MNLLAAKEAVSLPSGWRMFDPSRSKYSLLTMFGGSHCYFTATKENDNVQVYWIGGHSLPYAAIFINNYYAGNFSSIEVAIASCDELRKFY